MRIAVSLLAIGLCLFLIQASVRFGVSRMFSRYALVGNSLPAADAAVRFAPSDPEAYRARATVLNLLQQPSEAVESLEAAAALRYRDDYLWIELGNTREELGDTAGAVAALDQAVRWAPYYAHTHWQRGNVLLRSGMSGEAFADLRAAARANPSYLPSLIDLAWGMSRGDLKTTEVLLDIKDDSQRLALIRFLAKKGRGREVADEIKSLTAPLASEAKNELVRSFFAAKAFTDAFDLYRTSEMHEPWLVNGGFEEPLVVSDTGFGWIVAPQPKVRLAVDVSEKLSGTKSLQVNFEGAWNPGTSLLAQTVIVKRETSYHFSFAVKTRDLVTGVPPIITFSDASNDQLLAKSENLPTATTPWVTLNAAFTTLPATQAVVIRLQRSSCDSSPCPIFGTLWLDEFHIKQIEPAVER
jgi:tetratricopeptide (TPR) repeat protein